MIKLPYRNTVKKNNNLNFNPNRQYQNGIGYKPSGFWYQINKSLFEWGELSWGNYIFTVEIKKNILNKEKGILSIKTFQEMHDFTEKYFFRCETEYGNLGYHNIIRWDKVAEDYGGIEIKNYNEIMKQVREIKNNFEKYSWIYNFDFSSGCIWDLKLIKELYFDKKITDDQIDDMQKYY
jgi:hypothetical protein